MIDRRSARRLSRLIGGIVALTSVTRESRSADGLRERHASPPQQHRQVAPPADQAAPLHHPLQLAARAQLQHHPLQGPPPAEATPRIHPLQHAFQAPATQPTPRIHPLQHAIQAPATQPTPHIHPLQHAFQAPAARATPHIHPFQHAFQAPATEATPHIHPLQAAAALDPASENRPDHRPAEPSGSRGRTRIALAAAGHGCPWRVPWYLWVLGGLASLAAIHARKPELLHGQSLVYVLLGLVFVLLVAAILWELPPAVMMCGALVLTVFSGHWSSLGLPGFPFLPDRILLVGALVALLLRSPGTAGLPQIRLKGVHLLMIVTVLYATASAVLAGTLSNQSAVFDLLDRLGALPFLMLVVAPAIFARPRERNWLLATLVGIGGYLGLTAVFETIGPHALVFPHYIRALNPSLTLIATTGTTQAAGPFTSVVTEGFACYAGAIAAIIAFFQWRNNWRWLAAGVAVISALGSFLTLERGVWIGTVAGALAVALLAREVRRWLIPAAALCAVVIIGALTVSPNLGAATHARVTDNYPVWDRKNQTAAAGRMIQAKPLFGFGWDNYANTATAYFRLGHGYPLTGFPSAVGVTLGPPGSSGVTTVNRGSVSGALHNSYLSYAVELGLVGASLWLVSVLWGLGSAVFNRGSPELRPWRLGLLALTVCFLVLGLFDPLNQNFTELVLWTWAGVVVAGAQTRLPVHGRQRVVVRWAPSPSAPGQEQEPALRGQGWAAGSFMEQPKSPLPDQQRGPRP
jgi:O-antigen ligase